MDIANEAVTTDKLSTGLQSRLDQTDASINQLTTQVDSKKSAVILDANDNQVGLLVNWQAASTAYIILEEQGSTGIVSVGLRGFHHSGSLVYTQLDCQGMPLIDFPSDDMIAFARLRENILYFASNTSVVGAPLIYSHWRLGDSSFDGICVNFGAPFIADSDYKTVAATLDVSIFTTPFRYAIVP